MKDRIVSLKKTARFAGLLYLLLALAAIYGFFYVSPKIMVSGDLNATASNMVAHESLFRSSIVSDLIANILFVAVVLLLYRLFKQVNEYLARVMVFLVVVAIPIALLGGGLQITALGIIKGDVGSFQTAQLQQLAQMFMKLNSYSSQMITIFWGLWLLPLGVLVYRSAFIPRILGVLLIINGCGYIITSITFILSPENVATVSKFMFPTYFVGEIPFIFWLLIVGVRDHLSITIVAETEAEVKPRKFVEQME
jgi:Domain of unknown function (DUF4386)